MLSSLGTYANRSLRWICSEKECKGPSKELSDLVIWSLEYRITGIKCGKVNEVSTKRRQYLVVQQIQKYQHLVRRSSLHSSLLHQNSSNSGNPQISFSAYHFPSMKSGIIIDCVLPVNCILTREAGPQESPETVSSKSLIDRASDRYLVVLGVANAVVAIRKLSRIFLTRQKVIE
jgi:hypothetical protein